MAGVDLGGARDGELARRHRPGGLPHLPIRPMSRLR